ncbi:enterochelin esterase [Streptomyces sp. NPDC059009]|uniref:enterochelin esterase n=1 Tax=Streptomyces sp. NPDC059009 TaxID=3346694 RepID=UPI0036A55C8C
MRAPYAEPATALPDHRPARVTGPRVARLAEQLDGAAAAERGLLVDAFWREVAARDTPLVEEIPGAPGHRVVTFLRRGHRAMRQVLFMSNGLVDRDRLADSRLEHLPGTDIWHLSLRLRADHRGSYRLAADVSPGEPPTDPDALQARLRALLAHAGPDPLNSRSLPVRWSTADASLFALPQAPAEAWRGRRTPTRAGRVERHRIPTVALGGERDVWVYLPPEKSREKGQEESPGRGGDGPLPVLVLCDGDMWFGRIGLQHSLDTLIAAGTLPPLAVLAPDAVDRRTRGRELGARDPFVQFLADELLPWAGRHGPLTGDPARTVVAGQSLGGMAALYAGLQRPDRFGHVVAQSPSLWWSPELAPGVVQKQIDGVPWLVRRFADTGPRPVTVHLDVGLHEGPMAEYSRALHKTLRSAHYRVTRNEFNGGHDYACWHPALLDAVARLLGPAAPAGPAQKPVQKKE